MTDSPSRSPLRRRSLLALAAWPLVPAVATPPSRNDSANAMPNGTWTIVSKPPNKAGQAGVDYLPPGTRIRLLFQGPPEYAVEHGLTNELAVTVGILGPIAPALCLTGLGQNTMFGGNVCDADGRPLESPGNAPFDFDAVAVFSRITGQPANAVEEGWYLDQGAKPGARLLSIGFKEKGFTWELWIKSADEIVQSAAWMVGPTLKDADSVPVIWRRE